MSFTVNSFLPYLRLTVKIFQFLRLSTKFFAVLRLSVNPIETLEEAFEFCWSSFTDEHNTLPKSTRRNVKLNKFAFGTLWLPDLLCKHWFTLSVQNFCRWIADVPPRKTSPAGKSEEKRLLSQAGFSHSFFLLICVVQKIYFVSTRVI